MNNLKEEKLLKPLEQKPKERLCDNCSKNEPLSHHSKYIGGDFKYLNSFKEVYLCDECLKKEVYLERVLKEFPSKYHAIETDNKQFIDIKQPMSLFITGNTGSGKTVFACSIGKKHLRNNLDVKFISYPSFIFKLQNSFGNDKENSYDLAEECAIFPGLLIIDDLGAEKITDFVRQMTYYILNEREQRELLTVITSNFSLNQLDEQVDPRVSSRIAGMCKVIKLNGKDRRIEK